MRCDFLVQRVSDRVGGTPQNNIQTANQEHPRPIQTTSNPEMEETLVKEIYVLWCPTHPVAHALL
jgi:hypothetical protein